MTRGPGGAASAGTPGWAPRRHLLPGLLAALLLHLPLVMATWSLHGRTRPEPREVVVSLAASAQLHEVLERARRQAPVPRAPARRITPRLPFPPPVSSRWRLAEAPEAQAPADQPVLPPAAGALPLPPLVADADMVPAAGSSASGAAGSGPALATADGEPPAGLPREGEVDYRVTKGSGEWRSGRGTLRWQLAGDHYRLDLDAHAEGLPALFWWAPVHWSSEGRVTAGGLRPDLFMRNRTDGVRFDWSARTLTFLPSGFVRPLPDGSLDLLSVFFQFALRPPADDSMDFAVTNGDKIDRYAFEMTDRTRLQLEPGEFETVHISRIHKLQENGFEIWLAQDRNFLPVQMRLYHARLGVLNLYATGIRATGLQGRLQGP